MFLPFLPFEEDTSLTSEPSISIDRRSHLQQVHRHRGSFVRSLLVVRRNWFVSFFASPFHSPLPLHLTLTSSRTSLLSKAMSITAFPVLCRILTELKLLDTTVGIVVLSAGVGNDVVGWVLLALTVALVNAAAGGSGSGINAIYILLCAIGWTIVSCVAKLSRSDDRGN